jgi:hypothetical protein
VKKAIFFVSTGRCGTQWLYDAFKTTNPDVIVKHESNNLAYNSLRSFGEYHTEGEISQKKAHKVISIISEIIKTKTYIDTGWTNYGCIPLIIEKLGDNAKFVHLVRDSTRCSFSLASHRYYSNTSLTQKVLINPGVKGVKIAVTKGMWGEMSMLNKCYWFWTELNAFALDMQKKCKQENWFFLKFEDLFSQDSKALETLVDFCSLKNKKDIEDMKPHSFDKYRNKLSEATFRQGRMVSDKTKELSELFGYKPPSEEDFIKLQKRFLQKD